MITVDLQATVGDCTLDVSLEIDGGATLLIGPNGAGKSTFLKCLLGAVTPKSGSFKIDGKTIYDGSTNLAIEDRRIAYVPQRYGLFSKMTVRQNVAFGTAKGSDALVEKLLKELDIVHLANRKAGKLSGGESQRVAIARAIAMEPCLLLLDEPMAALDAVTRSLVRGFLATRLRESEVPSIVVSHDPADVGTLSDSIVVLEQGTLRKIDLATWTEESEASDFVKTFLSPKQK